MLTPEQWREAQAILPFLTDPTTSVARAFADHTTHIRLPAGMTIFSEGDNCQTFAILLAGCVRVFKIGATGREITLYRFGQAESCILTVNCILSQQHFPAIARVEQTGAALVVPHEVFYDWMHQFADWRTYVFQLLAQRLATVMAVVDEVAFRRMDVRIAEFLLRATTSEQPVLYLTHQALAAELGTAREVVSRILADFAGQNLVLLTRGAITIQDRAGLARLVAVYS